MRFNVVVANPPFSLDKWGAEDAAADRYKRFQRGVPPDSKGDYAFISHMIETTYVEPARRARGRDRARTACSSGAAPKAASASS